jgi:hypothetical protein
MNDDIEAKKVKIDLPSNSTNQKSSTPIFLDENISNKKLCKYGEACYRQDNPIHTAEYDHPCSIVFER